MPFRQRCSALARLRRHRQPRSGPAGADNAAQQSLKLAQQQYRLGTISYIQLLVARQQARQIQYSLVAAQAQRLTDSAALYLSMGAGEHERK